jgi:hypothetical protein
MGYRSPLSKTFTIKAPAIFQTSSNSGGALSISPPNIKGHLCNDMTNLIRKTSHRNARTKRLGGWILAPKNIGRDQSHHGCKYCETTWNSHLHINRHPKVFRR